MTGQEQEISQEVLDVVLEKTAYTVIENIPLMITDINKALELLKAVRDKVDLYITNLEEAIKNDT